MPETTENYHHVPVRSAGQFVKESFRTITVSASKGIKAIIGKLKSEPSGSTKIQKYLFKTSKWSMAEAKAWVKKHNKGLKILTEGVIKLEGDPKKEKKNPYEFRAPFQIKKSFDKENPPEGLSEDVLKNYRLVFECVMSTSTKDWDKDIVAWSAIEKGTEQLKSKVVLFNHHHDDPPIGRFLKTWGVKREKKFRGIECGEIHTLVGLSKTAEQIAVLIEEEILTDMSIGGILEDAEEFYDDDDRLDYRVIKDWYLYEGSVVNFGANPEAQITNVLGKLLKDRKGGVNLTKDDTPDPDETPDPTGGDDGTPPKGDDELPPEVDVWEIIQEQLQETLEAQKEEILGVVESKIEETRTQSEEGLSELRTAATESLEQVQATAENQTHLLETIFQQQGFEMEEEDPDSEDDDDDEDEEK